MARFEVTYTDGRTEVIEAEGCWPNDWGAAFVREEARPSKARNARPTDVVVKHHTFRFIAGRMIAEIRELA